MDNAAPTIGSAGVNATISCPATPVFTAPTASDACSGATVQLVSDVTTQGSCAGTYTEVRTWRAVDACGNISATVAQTITVIDNTPPTIGSAGVNATISCPATPVFTTPTASDACSGATVQLVSDVTTQGSCAGTYTEVRTWRAVDACGNISATVAQTITVIDNTPPTIGSAGVNATISCPATPVFTAPTASDACSGATVQLVSDVTTQGSCAGTYTEVRTWRAVDACGNISATVAQTITVIDNTPPTIGSAGVNATISCPATPVFTAPTASDACSGATVQLVSDVTTQGSCAGTYTEVRTWRAVDACGNISATVAQTITVIDNTPPTIGSAGVNATISCPATPVFTAPTASDACSGATVQLVSDVTTQGSCAGTYTEVRTWRAVDACGNISATVAQTITVIDNTPPTIGSAGVNATISCPATPVFTAPTASDACSGATVQLVSDVTTQGSCAGTYTEVRTWRAVDACGNISATVAQRITVIDNTPPTIGSAGVNATISCPATPVFTAPTASDACSGATVQLVSDVTTQGSCAGTYTEVRTWRAVDACGNISASLTHTITTMNYTLPLLDSLPIYATISCPATPVFTAPTASDACSGATVQLVSDVTTQGSCAGTYTEVRTWRAVDACGNISATVAQRITVIDNTPPTIGSAGVNATISCPATPVFTAPTASDACSGATVQLVSDVTTQGSCAGTYTEVRTWRAVDACGNISASLTHTITTMNYTLPLLDSLPIYATISCPATPVFTAPTASDACSGATVQLVSDVTTQGSCAGTYTEVRTWRAVDACGNISATVAQRITVIDNTPPIIGSAGVNATISCPATPVFTAQTASDACSGATVQLVSDVTTQGSCAGTYTEVRTCISIIPRPPSSTLFPYTTLFRYNTPPTIGSAGVNATISCPATPV